jgi:hypothetical protein
MNGAKIEGNELWEPRKGFFCPKEMFTWDEAVSYAATGRLPERSAFLMSQAIRDTAEKWRRENPTEDARISALTRKATA